MLLGIIMKDIYLNQVRPFCRGRWVTLTRHEKVVYADKAQIAFSWISPWPTSEWGVIAVEDKPTSANASVAKLLSVFREPADVSPGTDPVDIMARLSACGIRVRLDVDQLKFSGSPLTDDLRTLIKANKPAMIDHLTVKPIESSPWDGALATAHLKTARESFGKMFDVLMGQDSVALREAAFAIMLDALQMLAESFANQTIGVAMAKADYIAWLCNEIRVNMYRLQGRGKVSA